MVAKISAFHKNLLLILSMKKAGMMAPRIIIKKIGSEVLIVFFIQMKKGIKNKIKPNSPFSASIEKKVL
jgi:hypothetical protein